jgi:hypothetical protein
MLMRPEYRTQISEAYKRRIEAIVRKSDKSVKEEARQPNRDYAGHSRPDAQQAFLRLSALRCAAALARQLRPGAGQRVL